MRLMRVELPDQLRPGNIKLARWNRKRTPPQTGNLLKAIVLFARYMGLRRLPASTIERLRHDELYRACFYRLSDHCLVYDDTGWTGREARERLLAILERPKETSPEDIFRGLRLKLNNFPCHLPGGMYRDTPAMVTSKSHQEIAQLVDGYLLSRGLFRKAFHLQKAALAEQDQEACRDRLELFKLALEVFDHLVQNEGFEPITLWR
ncbi:MAG: hypothetical protein JW782_02205 [Candidatus Saganbacteria bacterium]|nr:hypothetical protein [Candidatus Saganbacteria bacterium]